MFPVLLAQLGLESLLEGPAPALLVIVAVVAAEFLIEPNKKVTEVRKKVNLFCYIPPLLLETSVFLFNTLLPEEPAGAEGLDFDCLVLG